MLHVWLSLPKYILCHISLSELLKKIWENSWWCPSFFSAFIFAHFLTWLQNHLHQTILQFILLFNIRAAGSANHSAFQCLGTLILQIILLFNVWADWFCKSFCFQSLGRWICKSFCCSKFGQMILQIHATIQDTGRFEKLCKRIDSDLERSRHAHSVREELSERGMSRASRCICSSSSSVPLPLAPCLGALHFASSEAQADKAPSLSVQNLVLQSHRDGPVSRPFLWSSAINFYWGFRVLFVWRSWRTRKEFAGAAFVWSFFTPYLSHALNSWIPQRYHCYTTPLCILPNGCIPSHTYLFCNFFLPIGRKAGQFLRLQDWIIQRTRCRSLERSN
jgi:hypothetical protein